MSRTKRRLSWAMLAGLVLGLLSLAGTAFAATGWTVLAVPGSDPGDNAILQGGSIVSPTDAWAVGAQFGPAGSGAQPAIAEQWNGTAWSRVSTPLVPNVSTISLTGVSASSATDAWAVGGTTAPGTGYHGGTSLFEHWNGTAWSVVSGANAGFLVGVVDLSPTNASAFGANGLVEHWDGTAWTIITTPHPNPSDTVGDRFVSVSADGPNDIWALGTFAAQATDNSSIYALHFDGTTWTVSSLPQPSVGAVALGVSSVDAVAPNDVWVAGNANAGAYVEHFNGTAWSQVALPASGVFFPSLTTIVARSATDMWVFGHGFASATSTTVVNLYLHFDGTNWSSAPSPFTGYTTFYAAAAGVGSPFWLFGNNPGNQPMILSHS